MCIKNNNNMNHAFQKLKLVIFILFSALFFGAISYKLILVSGGPFQEFDAHILFAKKMAEELRPTLPHFLFQAATIIHHGVLSFVPLPTHEIIGTNDKYTYDWGFAAFLVMIETYVGIALLLFFHLIARRQVGENSVGDNSAYFVAFGLSIAAPLFFFGATRWKILFGLHHTVQFVYYSDPSAAKTAFVGIISVDSNFLQ